MHSPEYTISLPDVISINPYEISQLYDSVLSKEGTLLSLDFVICFWRAFGKMWQSDGDIVFWSGFDWPGTSGGNRMPGQEPFIAVD